MERHVPRGGGNSLKPSHNQCFSLAEVFNNLALWGEKKFVSEQERTYKYQRGVNNKLDCHANQTRILSKEYSFVAGDYVRSTARNDVKRHTEDNSPKYRMVSKIYQCLTNVDKRLRNKCAMTNYGHVELVSASCGLNPSPAFQAPSPQVARGKVSSVGNMKENIFSNMVYSLFTTHHLLRKTAFTLAEVLITLGIIGVVAALTLPALINNYEKSVVETRMQKFYTNINTALKLSIVENGDMVDWTFPQDYYDADGSEKFFNTYLKNNLQYLKTVPRVTTSWPTNGIEVDLNDGSAFVLSGTWITYYPNANKKQRSGVDSFIFIINKNGNSVIPHGNELKLSENTLKKVNDVVYSCNGNTHRGYNRSCAAYIMQNGWKIPEYYPWGDLKKVK